MITRYDDLLNAAHISTQVKIHGEELVKVTLSRALIKCADALAVEMPPSRVDVITSDLMDMYPHDSIEDIILALKMGRRGQFGKIYGRLNLELINEWITQVLEGKSRAREQEQNKYKNEFKEPLPCVDYQAYNERMRAEKQKKVKAIEMAIIKQELRKDEETKTTNTDKVNTASSEPEQTGKADSNRDGVPPQPPGYGNHTGDNYESGSGPETLDNGKENLFK